jgi:uncharacterized membrane protein YccC
VRANNQDSRPGPIRAVLDHLKALLALQPSQRPWHLPVVAGLCVGVPALLGAWLGHFQDAILACVGAMVILYLPGSAMPHRMVTLAVCSFGFTVCFALGLLTDFNAYLSAAMLFAITLLVTVICRYYAVAPPGPFFFVMVAALATTLSPDLARLPERVGLVALGGMFSCLLAFFYSLCLTRHPRTAPPVKDRRLYALVLEAGVIALCVGGSLLLANALGMDNPYWAPISCMAILQGATFRVVWHRNVHRIAGTVLGMGLAWVILGQSLNPWQLALVVMTLQVVIEFLVVRNYGMAVIFITPLTVLYADFSTHMPPEILILTRLKDIVLGSLIGFLGGWLIHQTRLFANLERRLVNRAGKR